MKIGFIGAGKVGFSLGKYLAVNGEDVTGYYSRTEKSAEEAAEFTGTRSFSSLDELVKSCDTLIITAPDGAICSVSYELADTDIAGKTVCHCSGSLSAAEALKGLDGKNVRRCSMHPLFPVSSRYESYKELKNAFFCIEGDTSCAEEWDALFRRLGNPTRMISPDIKKKYHAACSYASNLVCGLMAESVDLLEECGFSQEEALTALRPLAMNNIERIFQVGAVNALTGPAERNDTGTVQKHIQCMPDDTSREMYKAVTRKLTEMSQVRHPDADYSEMNEMLK